MPPFVFRSHFFSLFRLSNDFVSVLLCCSRRGGRSAACSSSDGRPGQSDRGRQRAARLCHYVPRSSLSLLVFLFCFAFVLLFLCGCVAVVCLTFMCLVCLLFFCFLVSQKHTEAVFQLQAASTEAAASGAAQSVPLSADLLHLLDMLSTRGLCAHPLSFSFSSY